MNNENNFIFMEIPLDRKIYMLMTPSGQHMVFIPPIASELAHKITDLIKDYNQEKTECQN